MSTHDTDEKCLTKGEHERECSDIKECCTKIVLIPGDRGFPGEPGNPGPNGPPGPDGSTSNSIQNITITNTDFTPLDPTNNIIVIDTSNFPGFLGLPPLPQPGFVTLKLANQWGLPARIQMISGGEVELNSTNPRVLLYWDGTFYHIIDNPANIRAFYPNTFNTTPPLTSPNIAPGDAFGSTPYSVAISGDGNTMIVGSSNYLPIQGAAIIFVRDSSGVWTQQALLTDDNSFGGFQGYSVAISSDGNIVAVGAPGDDVGQGATLIYTRSANVWTLQVKLVGVGGIGAPAQGSSVALSADGNTLAVGAPHDNVSESDYVGAVWIFKNTGTWDSGTKIVPTGYTGFPQVGTSVALSADGSTLASGGPLNSGRVGATWVWILVNGVWTQQQILVGSDYTDSPQQGLSIDLSADGNTLAIGGPFNGNPESPVPRDQGAVWIFVRSNGVWTQQAGPLAPSDANPVANFGIVALSADGNTLAVGGYSDSSDTGAVWVFRRLNGSWSQYYSKLVDPAFISPSQVGTAVDLSSDGSTLVDTAPGYNEGGGAVAIFQ